ncbi:hypothetical protein GGR50DRAFT_651306 [Xylaria sp. CBS 124048]|nr:hypothetical protein GGR50DRAFT_651306 [Xylaria sp. CBS 124048]
MTLQSGLPRKGKVKTGCRTCKARRVKCDEGRPACSRCVSTGRACEGYGIWGGGSTGVQYAGRAAVTPGANSVSVVRAPSDYPSKFTPEQESYFQWFKCRTFVKLPLPFITPFWHTLILQACAAEPAILHAALALGSAHQKESFDEEGISEGPDMALDSRQRFMLKEYGRAIRSLQPHFSNSDRRSVRVALAVCILFTFLENLRGRYVAATAHLHSGLRLLAEQYPPVELADNGVVAYDTSRGYLDDWIIETFTRLHIQAALLGQGLLSLHPKLPVFPTSPMPTVFDSTNQAAHHMDRLMLEILHLAEEYSMSSDNVIDPMNPPKWPDSQNRLAGELRRWLTACNAMTSDICETFSRVDEFYMKVLRGYHTMANIILSTCVRPASEAMYDLYTKDFISLLEQLVTIWKAHVVRPAWQPKSWMSGKISHSVGDKGWIPLLYFIAVKCRVHRIRVQAIQLLSLTEHKEGTWDSRIAIVLAEEIVRIEEGDRYRGFLNEGKFDLANVPSEEELSSSSPLPEYCRLYDIRVRLPDHPLGVLVLEYVRRREGDGMLERGKRCYDPLVKRWV